MGQIEIINAAVGYRPGEKNRGKRKDFLEFFNEQMGAFAITRQTFCKWGKGMSRPDTRILTYATGVYPEGDPRHSFAAELLAVQGE